MIYTSALAAIVSVLAEDAIGGTSVQAWQKLCPSGGEQPGSLALLIGSRGGDLPRGYVDAMVGRRLHRELKPFQWNALVARFCTKKEHKEAAIRALYPVIASHAPAYFLKCAVITWAVPPLRGVAGKRSSDMLVLPKEMYCMSFWGNGGETERTRQRWRKDIHDRLDGIVRDAILAAEEILKGEGLLFDQAA